MSWRTLETVMGDILHTSNVENLIGSLNGKRQERQQEINSNMFSNQIQEMFPDVDTSFLLYECRSLNSEEDYTRFINTVMLSGTYPKETPGWCDRRSTAAFTQDNEVHIVDYSNSKPVVYSSDEEIPSYRVVESGCWRGESSISGMSDSFAVGIDALTETNYIAEETVKNEEIEVKPEQGGKENGFEAAGEELQMDAAHLISGSRSEPREGEAGVLNLTDYSEPGRISPDCGLKTNENCDADQDAPSYERSDNPEMLPRIGNGTTENSARRDSNKSPTSSWEVPDEADGFQVAGTSRITAELGDATHEENPAAPEEWLEQQTAELIRLFPNTDPTFLRAECAKFEGLAEAMNEFVLSKLEKNDMPSRADYEKRREVKHLQDSYVKNFSVEDFLQAIPDPWAYFNNSNRNCAKYKAQSLIFLENSFRNIHSRLITATMMKNNFNLYLSYKELQEKSPSERMVGSCYECNLQGPARISVQFLQEVAFIENEEKIKDFIKEKEIARQMRLEEARRTGGTILECKCCYDPEVMIEDIVYCPKDHSFCKPCVARYVQVEMGEARFDFVCLAGCGEKYTLFTLQTVVKPEIISKIVQAKQMEEIRAAGIDGLVQCPFCSYAAVMPPDDKVLSCLNPQCQKKTCRLCKELCHIPLRCDEVERSEEVKMRTYIENKMSQALIRTCYNCGKGFVKEDGCNKIVCKCGAKMCYVCRKPVTGYSHFNGYKGSTDCKKCPLYSTNDELHADLVKKAAQEAKAEILNSNKTLKHDPTAILPKSCKSRSRPTRRHAGSVHLVAPFRFAVSKKCKSLRTVEE